MNDEYMPKPSRNATVFVVQTPRMRIMCMSTSGLALADSLRTQATSSPAPIASTINVFADNQCQLAASVTASSTAARPPDMSAAPAQLTRPDTRTGDSGTSTWIATVAATSGTSGSQNNQ